IDTIDNWFPRLSPHGAWVAWQSRANDEAPMRLRTMNVETGEIGIDLTAANTSDLDTVTRGSLIVRDGRRRIPLDIDGNARAIDPVSKVITPVTLPSGGACIARTDRELVCEDHGSVSVVKL